MIIPLAGSTSKVDYLETTNISGQPKDVNGPLPDYPPPYTPEPRGIPGSTPDMAPPTNWARRESGPPAQRPTNMVSTSKLSGSIKGSWVVDPAVVIPAPLLPTLCPGETEESRRNLYLKTNNGAIAADVTLVPRASVKDGRRRVTLAASTLNGSVKFNLREAWMHENPTPARLPFKLSADSLNGAISISIPRSFRGVIVGATFSGSVKLSDEVNAQVLYEKTDGRARRIFIGEFDQEDFAAGNEWLGDEVNADTKSGSVKIRYEDEGESSPDEGGSNKARSQGLLTKIWEAIF